MGAGSLQTGLVLRRDAEAARLITATDRIGRELGIRDVRASTPVKAELNELERRLGPEEWERHRVASADLSFDDLVAEARALSAAEVQH